MGCDECYFPVQQKRHRIACNSIWVKAEVPIPFWKWRRRYLIPDLPQSGRAG